MSNASMAIKLLDAAEYRMRRGGYNSVSFRDLASDANIKSSSVHYYYPRKEDLGTALIERYSASFFTQLADAARDSTDPKDRLMAFRSIYRSALKEDDALCLCALLGAETDGLPDVVSASARSFFQANIDWVSDALALDISATEKVRRARTVVAGHQGAMMLANSMQDIQLFDGVTKYLIDQVAANA